MNRALTLILPTLFIIVFVLLAEVTGESQFEFMAASIILVMFYIGEKIVSAINSLKDSDFYEDKQ